VASSNAMATVMASINAITMILIITVINGVVVRLMGVTLSIVSLTAIIMEGVTVRGGRMVVLTGITTTSKGKSIDYHRTSRHHNLVQFANNVNNFKDVGECSRE